MRPPLEIFGLFASGPLTLSDCELCSVPEWSSTQNTSVLGDIFGWRRTDLFSLVSTIGGTLTTQYQASSPTSRQHCGPRPTEVITRASRRERGLLQSRGRRSLSAQGCVDARLDRLG